MRINVYMHSFVEFVIAVIRRFKIFLHFAQVAQAHYESPEQHYPT